MYDPNTNSPSRRNGSGGGIGGRLIVAIIIALVAWFMYATNTEVNPVTGQKQHVSYSPDQEIQLGLKSAPEMARQMGGELPNSDPRARVVQKMGNYIVSKTSAAKSPWKFHFHLLADDQTVNAFALPGGQIFITLGLLEKLQTEAELAGVLSHEMGHVIQRHSSQQMAKTQLGQSLVYAVGTAASEDPNNSAAMVAAVVNQMTQLHYSRSDESEADQWGIMLMTQAGFKPQAMIEVMEILKASSGRDGGPTSDFFQTHPNPDLRIEQIKAYLKEHPPEQGLSDGRLLKNAY